MQDARVLIVDPLLTLIKVHDYDLIVSIIA
jgi:hypothetical protein